MKHKIYLFIFAIVLTLALGSFERVLACSCRQQQPICEAYGNAKAIFVGEVVEGKSVETMSERLAVKSNDLSFVFKVKQNFLGTEEAKEITIHTGFGGGDCGFPFQKGESYLVYAYEYDGNIKTNICTRTNHISRVEDDFEELKSLLLNKGARLYGTVTQYAKSSLETDWEQPMNKLKLQVEQLDGAKKKFEVVTDEKGKYELTDLSTGVYKVVPFLPNGLMVEDYTMSEFLLNDKGCTNKDFYVKNSSQVRGKVIDAEGKSVKSIAIDLIPPTIKSKPDNLKEHTYSDSDGTFRFYNIPAGKYLVAANYINQPNEKNPFPTTFYKLNGEKSIGTTIEVGLGQKIEGLVIQLPQRLPMKEIRGKVVWKNGKPTKAVAVNLRDFESRQNISGFDTDANGNFVVKGFVGRKYILETYIEMYVDGEYVKFGAKDVEFVLNEKTGRFTLTLEKEIEEQ